MRSRLEALGIREGKRITLVSVLGRHGPVILQVEGSSSQIAVGRGMAARILVSEPAA